MELILLILRIVFNVCYYYCYYCYCCCCYYFYRHYQDPLHKKWSFPLRISIFAIFFFFHFPLLNYNQILAILFPPSNCLFRRGTGAGCEACSEWKIRTSEQIRWCTYGAFIVNFEHISHFICIHINCGCHDKMLIKIYIHNKNRESFVWKKWKTLVWK